MNQKMQVAVVVEFGAPLEIQEWNIPTPGPGQILVKTEACGVCHSDVHAWRGDWPLKPKPPFIPGHEGIGSVVAVGAGVTNLKNGDRVGVPWLYSACGHCEYCLSAWEKRSIVRIQSIKTRSKFKLLQRTSPRFAFNRAQ